MRFNESGLLLLSLFLVGCERDHQFDDIAKELGASDESYVSPQDQLFSEMGIGSDLGGTAELPATSEESPIVWNASLDPTRVTPGQTVIVSVHCGIHPDWHIYSMTGPTGVGRPTKIELKLPELLKPSSEWLTPESETVMGFNGPESHYAEDCKFMIELLVDENASPQQITLNCEIHYQACKDVSCLPPDSQTLELSFEILDPKG